MSIGGLCVVLFAVFFLALFLGVPISFGIILSSIATLLCTGELDFTQIMKILPSQMRTGVESYSLLAIPLFIFAGNIMNTGGIAKRLVTFVQIFVGKVPGSLAHANILGNMLFGALSGSSVAAASAIGGCIAPIEKENNYDPAFSAAANIISAPTGLLIPPTAAFIIYAQMSTKVNVSTMFMAGYIPGILIGLVSMIIAFIMAKRLGIKATPRDKSIPIWKAIVDALPSVVLVLIIIIGVVTGFFTATQAAGVAVIYCLILSLCYRSLTFKSFMQILFNTAKVSGIVLFLIAASTTMSFTMGYTQIPGAIADGLLGISSNKIFILIAMNVILMVVGMFLDITPACLIFCPIFLPIARSLGMSDVQFGVMLVFNMCLGNVTPPVGSVLFVGCGVGETTIEKVTPKLIPYFVALFVLLLLVTFIPALSEWLPKITNQPIV